MAGLLSWDAFTRIDFLGSASLLCGSGFLIFAMQQAGSQTFAWGSPTIVSSLVLSGLSCALFVWWEVYLSTKRGHRVEPVFPIGLMCRRVFAAGLV